jgi:alpha-beta hydrolase superfamily lysophospholipase
MIAQGYAERCGDGLAGLALSGTSGPSLELADSGAALQGAVDAGMGDEVLEMLGPFNEQFEPARTPFDWLSRDPAEVDAYIADPLCGDEHRLTYGYVAGLMTMLASAMEPEQIELLPKHLPVLLVTGDRDPVSANGVGVREFEKRLRAAGLDVTAHYYPEARHELLNETNRDEVQEDIITWLNRSVSSTGEGVTT